MGYDDNPYYYPEKHGLVQVAEHELSPASYSFDMIVAWKGADGFYLGTDSGCSCPTPFEDYNGTADMTGPLTAAQAVEEAASIKSTHYEPDYDQADFEKFVAAINAA